MDNISIKHSIHNYPPALSPKGTHPQRGGILEGHPSHASANQQNVNMPQGQQEQILGTGQNRQQTSAATQDAAKHQRNAQSLTKTEGLQNGLPGGFSGQQMMGMNAAAISGSLMNGMMMAGMFRNGQAGGAGVSPTSGGAASYQGINDVDQLMQILNQKRQEQGGILNNLGQNNKAGMDQMRSNTELQKQMAGLSQREQTLSMQDKMLGMKEKMLGGAVKAMQGAAKGLQGAAKGLDAAGKGLQTAATAAAAVPIVGTAIAAALKVVAKMIQMIAKMLRAAAKALQAAAKKMQMTIKQTGAQRKQLGTQRTRVRADKQRGRVQLQNGMRNYKNTQKQIQQLMQNFQQNQQHQSALQTRLQELGSTREGNNQLSPLNQMGGVFQIMNLLQANQMSQSVNARAQNTMMSGAGMAASQNMFMQGGLSGIGTAPSMGGAASTPAFAGGLNFF